MQAFARRFGGRPDVLARAPGRVNLIGEHVDYSDGHVLPVAIDRDCVTALRRSTDGRWRAYDYADLIARDKASLDIFWLKDDSLADSDNLPPPDVIAQEIVDDLEAALEQFRLITGDLTGELLGN